jgi:hypothetical protein
MAKETESDFYGSTTFFKCRICRKIIFHLVADAEPEMASAPMNQAEDPEQFL